MRSTRTDGDAQLLRTLVDAPFYARSLFDTGRPGAPDRVRGVHEVVDLARFTRRTTQFMLPFRTRGAWWY
jgi:carotenoid 1,2-hydratase